MKTIFQTDKEGGERERGGRECKQAVSQQPPHVTHERVRGCIIHTYF